MTTVHYLHQAGNFDLDVVLQQLHQWLSRGHCRLGRYQLILNSNSPIYWGSQPQSDASLRLKWCAYFSWQDNGDERSRCCMTGDCVNMLFHNARCPVQQYTELVNILCWSDRWITAWVNRSIMYHFIIAVHGNVCPSPLPCWCWLKLAHFYTTRPHFHLTTQIKAILSKFKYDISL